MLTSAVLIWIFGVRTGVVITVDVVAVTVLTIAVAGSNATTTATIDAVVVVSFESIGVVDVGAVYLMKFSLLYSVIFWQDKIVLSCLLEKLLHILDNCIQNTYIDPKYYLLLEKTLLVVNAGN